MIIFDEVTYAELIIQNGCSQRNVLIDFKILAKYFIHYKHKTDQETREEMLNILKDSQTFIPINYLVLKIDKAISFAKTENLKVMNPIIIYKEEIDVVNNITDESLRDLAIVYLFLSKWSNDEKGFFIKEADVKKLLGKQSLRNKDLQIKNKLLEDIEFIKFIDTRTKELIKVLITKDDGEEAFRITDFRHPVLHYRQYMGEKIKQCENCKCLIKMTSSNNKYCKDCKKTIKNLQTNQSKQRAKTNKSL